MPVAPRPGPFRGIVLIGFMGSGKTSVGREIARRTGAEFVDVDERIETASGRSVPEIFAGAGEPAFRELEREAIREAVSVPGRVIATGGGAFQDEENRGLLRAYGPVVLLSVTPETVLARLAEDRTRPLLAAGDRERRIRELLAARLPGYRAADFAVAADGRTVEEVADAVLALPSRGGRRRGDRESPGRKGDRT